jgi:hypothetical protein
VPKEERLRWWLMSDNAPAPRQTIWDCRWSRPRYPLSGVEVDLQPEELWVCVRGGERRGVTEEECEHCSNWEALPVPLTRN